VQAKRQVVYRPLFSFLCAIAAEPDAVPLLASTLAPPAAAPRMEPCGNSGSDRVSAAATAEAAAAGEPGSALSLLRVLEAQVCRHVLHAASHPSRSGVPSLQRADYGVPPPPP
jgi:hypothetical protein